MNRHRLAISCFILAFCSLNYEFLLAQMMSILGGHTILFYCLTIGLYIFALGMGALMQVEDLSEKETQRRLYSVEMQLCILGGGVPFWLIGTDLLLQRLSAGVPVPFYASLTAHGAFIILIGVLSGRELPLILRLAEIKQMKQLITRLLALDYAASFLGAVSFPLFLFPQLGIVRAGSLLAMLNVLAIAIAIPIPTTDRRFYLTAAAFGLAILVYASGDGLAAWLSLAL